MENISILNNFIWNGTICDDTKQKSTRPKKLICHSICMFNKILLKIIIKLLSNLNNIVITNDIAFKHKMLMIILK